MNDSSGNINTKIDFSSISFKKYFANTSWLFLERILRIVISFIVSVFVVRYLGPKEFGIYSYAISFAWLFASISTLGLELATNPFLRCDEAHIKAAAERFRGQPLEDESDVFQVLRYWKGCLD